MNNSFKNKILKTNDVEKSVTCVTGTFLNFFSKPPTPLNSQNADFVENIDFVYMNANQYT